MRTAGNSRCHAAVACVLTLSATQPLATRHTTDLASLCFSQAVLVARIHNHFNTKINRVQNYRTSKYEPYIISALALMDGLRTANAIQSVIHYDVLRDMMICLLPVQFKVYNVFSVTMMGTGIYLLY